MERAFRCIKTVDLHVRPVYHWLADRVRAHVFLCMLAYYLEWHMRQKLAPMLFDDTEKQAAEAARDSVVAGATLRGRDPQADHGRHTGWTAGAQLPHAAGRSGDTGTQYHRHRDCVDPAAHRADAADPGAAPGVRAAGARSVASNRRPELEIIVAWQWFMFLERGKFGLNFGQVGTVAFNASVRRQKPDILEQFR